MRENRPLIRAAYLRENVSRLAMLGGSNAQIIRAALRADTLDRIEQSTVTNWLPLEFDVELTDAVGRLAGPAALGAWAQASLEATTAGPLLRPVVDGAIRVFGLDPASLLRLVPRAWPHVFRNAGNFELLRCPEPPAHPGHRSLTLRYVDVPACLAESVWYAEGVSACFAYLVELCQSTGFSRVEAVGDELHFTVTWRTRGADHADAATPMGRLGS